MSTLKYSPQVELDEHDLISSSKRVMMFGWDANNLQAVRLNVDDEGSIRVETWNVNDVEKTPPITYIGQEKSASFWRIKKIDVTSGTVVRYATIINNPTKTTYATAWTDRASLTYEIYSETV